MGAKQRVFTAGLGYHTQRGLAPGHTVVQRGRGHDQVIKLRAHSRT